MIDLHASLIHAKQAASIAGDFLKSNISNKKNVLLSEGRDIKLEVDLETEHLIIDYLTKHAPYQILGEETGLSGNETDFYWVIDPLDGTSNYFRDIPISCVSIALMSKLDPILGVIYDFNHDELYYGSSEESARVNETIISVSSLDNKGESTLVTGIPAKTNYSDAEFASMIADFQVWKKVRMIGSAAMASVYVAAGKAETYQENGIFLWDIAAGAAIVKAAGGKIDISEISSDFRVNAKFTNGII